MTSVCLGAFGVWKETMRSDEERQRARDEYFAELDAFERARNKAVEQALAQAYERIERMNMREFNAVPSDAERLSQLFGETRAAEGR